MADDEEPVASPNRADILAALIASDDGMTLVAIRDLYPELPGKTGTARRVANVNRCVSQLAQDGLIERFGEIWKSTEKGSVEGVRVLPKHPGPLLDKLPEAPPEAKPVRPGRTRERVLVGRVQGIAEGLQSIAQEHGTPEEIEALKLALAVHGIADWRTWLPTMWPKTFTSGFGPHHGEFWDWVWEIEAGKPQTPFIALWNRGGTKSVSMEAACVAVAARARRKYVLYVSGTQTLADEHVGNIGSMLVSPEFASVYPLLSEREVGKYGESKGWRRNRLRTAAGFTVDALGLDVAARGTRIEEQRPDLIVLDDVDTDNDTPATTEKKVRAITRKLLPAGSQDVAVLFGQNMIHSQSIAARLARMPSAPKADFLARRIVSGPVPAVYDLTWAQVDDAYQITGGTPSWEGMPLEACQHMLDMYGLTAFLVECQHVEADLSGGMFDHLDFGPESRLVVEEAEVPRLRHIGCWVDPAVSAHDRSDSCGLVIDGLGVDRRYYRLWSWERISTPINAMKTAIRVAVEMGVQYRPQTLTLGVETDQGGLTWEVVFRSALAELMDEDPDLFSQEGARVPRYDSAKAGTTRQSKSERAGRMLADYELGKFRHVRGRCSALEAGLHRFPRYKPFDCVDAAYWSWRHLAEIGGEQFRRTRVKAARGSVGQVSPANVG